MDPAVLEEIANPTEVRGASWHAAGNLMPHVLKFIARVVYERYPNGIGVSVETGCGLSTVLLSQLSKKHICFTIGPTTADDSLERVKSSKYFNADNVIFIEGPTQLTMPKHNFTDPVNFALIDGPHGYPFPDLEYFYIYPHLSTWATLAIDDIHIPSIARMNEFIAEDTMFDYFATVGTTAFYTRNDQPTFYPYGDGWQRQRYNTRRVQER